MKSILVTIPTWNEETCIEANVRLLHDVCEKLFADETWTIEIADNGSTDRTREIVQGLEKELSRVHLRSIDGRGKGMAIKTSWLAHENLADAFVFLDADLAADVHALRRLVQPILDGDADVVCGSRFLSGTTTKRSWTREVFSRLFRYWQRAVLRLLVQDAQCGFKAVSREIVREIVPFLEERTWLFDSELLFFVQRSGRRMAEIPVDWVEHRDVRRRSALRLWKDGWMFLSGVWRIRQRKNLSTGFR